MGACLVAAGAVVIGVAQAHRPVPNNAAPTLLLACAVAVAAGGSLPSDPIATTVLLVVGSGVAKVRAGGADDIARFAEDVVVAILYVPLILSALLFGEPAARRSTSTGA